MIKKIFIASVFLLAQSLMGQSFFSPPPVLGMCLSSAGWVPLSSTVSGTPLGFSPAQYGLYGRNSNGQYYAVACDTNGNISSSSAVPGWLGFQGDGSEGALSVPSGNVNLNGEHWYSSITIAAGASVTFVSQNPPLILRSTGACTIAGSILANGVMGAVTNYGASGGGGGGGAAGGSAGSNAGIGTAGGSGGAIGGVGGAGNPTLASMYNIFISGFGPNTQALVAGGTIEPFGGSKGGQGGSAGGAGGAGGGAVILDCASMNFTGTIDASGAVGGASTGNSIGAGGGGGGGFVIMRSPTWTANTGTINVGGGAGGSCGAFTGCGAGGAGGTGWFYKFLN